MNKKTPCHLDTVFFYIAITIAVATNDATIPCKSLKIRYLCIRISVPAAKTALCKNTDKPEKERANAVSIKESGSETSGDERKEAADDTSPVTAIARYSQPLFMHFPAIAYTAPNIAVKAHM